MKTANKISLTAEQAAKVSELALAAAQPSADPDKFVGLSRYALIDGWVYETALQYEAEPAVDYHFAARDDFPARQKAAAELRRLLANIVSAE